MRSFRISFLILSLVLGDTKIVRAQHDTTLEGHSIIVRGKFNFRLPTIEDSDFCDEFRHIAIPKDLPFIDTSDGKELSYFFSFTLIFSKKKVTPEIKEKNRNELARPMIDSIISLLKHAKWKVFPGSYNHEIRIFCSLEKNAFKEVNISSNDNADTYSLCK